MRTIIVGVLLAIAMVNKEVFSYRTIPRLSRFRYLFASTFENDVEPTLPLGPGGIKSSNNLEERRPLKVALLALAARTNRGEIANMNEKDRASELVKQLESYNPSPDPAMNELSLGRWELVFASTQLFRSSKSHPHHCHCHYYYHYYYYYYYYY